MNGPDLFAGAFLFFICFMLGELGCEFQRWRWRRKCGYDCSQCKVWDCPYHECEKKRRELTK